MTLSYQLGSYNGGPSSPEWVSLDSSNKRLTFKAPYVTSQTNFSFSIDSFVTGDATAIQKEVFLSISPWNTQNCKTCEFENLDKWTAWKDGFVLSSNYKWSPSEKEDNAVTAVQLLAIAGITLASLVAVVNLSNPSSIWIVFNQYQLFLLLLITGAYFPDEIVKLLTGMNFTLFSFNFLDPLYENTVTSLKSWNYSSQENTYMEEMGLESNRSFYNVFSLIGVLLWIIFIHMVYLLWFWTFLTKIEKFSKLYKWIYQLFSFTVYIRIMIQSNQYLLIASWSEIKNFDYSSASKTISLFLSFLFYSFWVLIPVIWIILGCKGIFSTENEKWTYFSELFSGMKNNKSAKAYIVLEILRKILLVSILLFLRYYSFN